MEAKVTAKTRYGLIDGLRGLALVNMVIYHFCFDIFSVYGLQPRWTLSPAAVVWERFICFSFILVAGASLNFSRRSAVRGLIISGAGVLMTVVTLAVLPDFVIWFGVLTCIGASVLLTQALRSVLERLSPFVGAAVSLALFLLTYNVPNGYLGCFTARLLPLPEWLYQNYLTAFFGFPPRGFYSSDYFPLLPWLFLFLLGFFLWRVIVRLRAERFFIRPIPLLSRIGKHTLLIYLLHQPVLMGICFCIFGHF